MITGYSGLIDLYSLGVGSGGLRDQPYRTAHAISTARPGNKMGSERNNGICHQNRRKNAIVKMMGTRRNQPADQNTD